jgi:RNA-directed DNA polymerase
MPAEQRERQNLNLAENTLHLCNQDKTTRRPGWIPGLGWKARISLRVQRGKGASFSNLMKHINVDTLREAFNALDGSKALGVDRVSKDAYAMRLEENLSELAERVQRGSYRPQPKREVLIPKIDGKMRPLAIACFEDKLVDWVVSKILNAVYDPLFIRNSFGYRENKSAHMAIKACYNSLQQGKRSQVVEIDFRSFFNTIPHRRLLKVIDKRIKDHRLQRLILRLLQGEVLKGGELTSTKEGTPQGGLASPVLANIYLHEMLDSWFINNWASYNRIIVRYADDAVFFFTKEDDATRFLEQLKERTSQYGLTLHPEKTKQLRMNKASQESFDFLGFTFYWGKQASKRMLKIKTSKQKLLKSIRDFYHWAKEIRNTRKLSDIWELAKLKISGHLNYFGFAINNLKCLHFCTEATRALFKWLNRRSQKRSYSWEGFRERLKYMPLYEPFAKREWKQLGSSFGRI